MLCRLLALAAAATAFAPSGLTARSSVAMSATMSKSKLTTMVKGLTKETFESIYEQEAWIVENGGSTLVKKTLKRVDEKAKAFGRENLTFQHALHERPMFDDEGLARLLDLYPRDKLGVFTMGEDPKAWTTWRKGSAGNLTGDQLLEAAKRVKTATRVKATSCNGHAGYNGQAASNSYARRPRPNTQREAVWVGAGGCGQAGGTGGRRDGTNSEATGSDSFPHTPTQNCYPALRGENALRAGPAAQRGPWGPRAPWAPLGPGGPYGVIVIGMG